MNLAELTERKMVRFLFADEIPTCSPLERSYKPKILAHYPENVPWNRFDQDAVRNVSHLKYRTIPRRILFCIATEEQRK